MKKIFLSFAILILAATLLMQVSADEGGGEGCEGAAGGDSGAAGASGSASCESPESEGSAAATGPEPTTDPTPTTPAPPPPECSSGQIETDGACGLCGTLRRDCDSNGFWGLWRCSGEGVCSPGDTETGTSCGNCGTQQRICTGTCQWGIWNCINQGICAPASAQCIGPTSSTYQTCTSICSWLNSGTDADADGVDAQCGDSLCDNVAGITDSTKTATETGALCSDGIDNDCDNQLDCNDPDCALVIPCCTNIARNCRSYSRHVFERINGRNVDEEDRPSRLARIDAFGFHACPRNLDDITCCPNPNSCVFNGVCYDHGTIRDVDGDGVDEICIARSPGQWINNFEFNCTNGIDDDLDGLVDCNDNDCDGSVNGTVKNQLNQTVSGVDMSLKIGLTPFSSTTTNQQGVYLMSPIKCGVYNLIVSHANYAPQTRTINITPYLQITENFEDSSALALGSSCEQDCTFVADNIVHASCNGVNGCFFFDDISMAACDNSQPGWVRDYDANNYVVCPSGAPQLKMEIKASVSCASGTLIKVTRIVLYKGKPVKLVVATCG